MSISLYKNLHRNKNRAVHKDEEMPRWLIACVAGSVVAFAGVITYGVRAENAERWERDEKIEAPGTRLTGTVCTVNEVRLIRGARVVKLLTDQYVTAQGEQLSKPRSIELQAFSRVSGSQAASTLPYWSARVGCPVGPTID